jgi:magnesium transporter
MAVPDKAVWIDLVDVTKDEEAYIEGFLDLEIPTRAEMQEIEASSRLYREGHAVFMTATLLIKTETESPETTAVTFILTRDRLVTIRYAEPWSFRTFAQRAAKSGCLSPDQTFVALMDTTIERLADILELVALELDHLSMIVFRRKPAASGDELQKSIMKIGRCGHILTKVRESLIDKNRTIAYADGAAEWFAGESKTRLKGILHDVNTLTDHATFLNGKINFLLDATLGMINIEQSRIIKIFSIAAVIFLPPTLVASIYGMNYELWPHNDTPWGFSFALGIMLFSVVTTLIVFKKQRWL